MRKGYRVMIRALALLLLLQSFHIGGGLPGIGAGAASQGSSFEAGEPNMWRLSGNAPGYSRGYDDTFARTGTRSFKFASTNTGADAGNNVHIANNLMNNLPAVEVEGGKEYTVSFWYFTKDFVRHNPSFGASMSLESFSEAKLAAEGNGHLGGAQSYGLPEGTTSEWTEFEARFTAHPDANRLRVNFGFRASSGEVWIDDLKIIPAEPANPGIPVDDAPFVHPGGLFKQSDLDRMKYMVEAGAEPWLTSFNQLRAEPLASYNYTVKGDPNATRVDRSGENRSEFESDVTAAYLNSLMWAVTGDERHAAKAVEIFNTWSNLKVVRAGGTEALDAGLYAWKLVEAAEIIQSTYDGWAADDLQKFKDMLVYPGYANSVPASVNAENGTFYWRIYNGDPGRHGNQDLIAWRAMITMGVFLDNRTMYDRALNYFKGLPHPEGDIPYVPAPSVAVNPIGDNEYFTTYQSNRPAGASEWGYNGVLEHYVWENGQNQESSRDQQHAFFGLGIAAGIAEVAWNQGDGVWNHLDNRLLKGFEFMARYNTSYVKAYPDQPEPWEPDDFIQRFDRTGRWYSKKINPYFENDFVRVSRGDFAGKRPVYEQAAAHFQVRMGFEEEAKWTLRSREAAIELSGYETNGFSLDHPGWGALTFRRPALTAGDPVQGFDGGVPQFGIHVLPGVIEAEHYDHFPVDGNGRTYLDRTPGNAGGAYRADGVDIRAVADDDYALTGLEDGEWVTYTVYVPETADYDLKLHYAAASDGGAITFAFGGADVTSDVQLPATAGEFTPGLHTVADNVRLEAGVQAMRVFVSGQSGVLELNRIGIERSEGNGPEPLPELAATLTGPASATLNEALQLVVGVEQSGAGNGFSGFRAVEAVLQYDPERITFATVLDDNGTPDVPEDDFLTLAEGTVIPAAGNLQLIGSAVKPAQGELLLLLFSDQPIVEDGELFRLLGKVRADGTPGDAEVRLKRLAVANVAETLELDTSEAAIAIRVAEAGKAALNEAIAEAEAVLAAAQVGHQPGQYPQSAVDALVDAAAAAAAVAANPSATAETVRAAVAELHAAIETFRQSVIGVPSEPVDKAALTAAIAEAQALLGRAKEGGKVGQYPAAAITALRDAIQAAEDVRNAAGLTQAQVNAAREALTEAVAGFRTQIVTLVPGATQVTIADLSLMARYYGVREGDDAWSDIEQADLTGEGAITIANLVAVARLILENWLSE